MNTQMMRIRIPVDVKKWVEERATRNFRSMNAEILTILDAVKNGEEDDPQAPRRITHP